MQYDAFISYCSEDKKIADAVCGTLESNKIRCWIAPRDVGPGRTWGSAIIEAIGDSAVMVVIFSQHSNGSPQVMREIERAVNKGVAIIPFRVENVVPSKDLEYFISSCHWLDAMNPPLEKHIGELADAILALQRRTTPAPAPIKEEPRKKSWAMWGAIALAAILAVGAGAWFLGHKSEAGETVTIERPADGASLVGPLLLSWKAKDLAHDNLSFEVSIAAEGKAPAIQRTARNSIVLPPGIEGKVRWKIRPLWQAPGQKEKAGQWNREQTFTYYPSALNRIIATRNIHVGMAEPDGFFVRLDGAELTGYEIDLLRDLGARILTAHGINAKPTITYTRRVWGEKFFRLLESDGAVDLLASAISITPEREKMYSILFTDPTLQYPQTMVAKPGVKPFVDGKLVLNHVGAVEKTTNETFARKLLGDSAGERFVPYSGSGAYDKMLADLVDERIDGALLDKPYALQKTAELKQAIGAELALTDITPEIVPGVELEKMGFAVRKTDRTLLQELNQQLKATASARDGVLSKSIPGW
ncbi:MAG TPA: TIR domain-containing protein [Chthoniobacterales bacterium]|jgi:ABC-type amino acid transport substrate-binding protein|nr:TIR domain-containing protein [Chthoniobacterales bacterium]